MSSPPSSATLSRAAPLGRHAHPDADRLAPAGGVVLPGLLLVLFLVYMFVGVSPLSDVGADARVEGNMLDRLAVFGLTGLAVAVLALRLRTAAALVARSWLVWLLLGWFSASVAWSAYPDLSVRRIVSVILVTIVCLAVAAGLRNLRLCHTLLAVVLTGVIAANLLALLLRPDFAITDIGVRGLYSQKNQAGLVGMVAFIVSLCWTVGRGRPLEILAGVGATALAFVFLVKTDSKTSLALALLAALAVPALLLLKRIGVARSALLAMGGLLVVLVAALAFTAAGGHWAALVSDGDTSFTGRTEIWDFAWSEIQRKPWTGFGYGAFWDVGAENDPLLRARPGEWLSQVKIGVINQAHDGFLDLMLQGGWPALGLALLLWAQVVVRLVRQFFASDGLSGTRDATLMFLVLMVVFLIHNVTETSIWSRGQMLASLSVLITFLAFGTPRPAPGRAGARRS